MADFATTADMLARFDASDLLQLTDGEDTPDDAKLEAALVAASNIVRAHVARQYDSARFDAVPPLLIDLACEIARYRLYQTAAPEEVKERHKDAMRQLDMIARGLMKLDEGAAPLDQRGGAILTSAEPRRFSRSALGGF